MTDKRTLHAHTQIPQILHEIIVGSSEMITARLGPYLLACLLHRNFALIRQPNPTNLKRTVLNRTYMQCDVCVRCHWCAADCGRRKRERYAAGCCRSSHHRHICAWHGMAQQCCVQIFYKSHIFALTSKTLNHE